MRTNKIAFTILALMIVASFILSACATATTVAPVEPVVTEAPVVPEVPATSGTSVKDLPQIPPRCLQNRGHGHNHRHTSLMGKLW